MAEHTQPKPVSALRARFETQIKTIEEEQKRQNEIKEKRKSFYHGRAPTTVTDHNKAAFKGEAESLPLASTPASKPASQVRDKKRFHTAGGERHKSVKPSVGAGTFVSPASSSYSTNSSQNGSTSSAAAAAAAAGGGSGSASASASAKPKPVVDPKLEEFLMACGLFPHVEALAAKGITLATLLAYSDAELQKLDDIPEYAKPLLAERLERVRTGAPEPSKPADDSSSDSDSDDDEPAKPAAVPDPAAAATSTTPALAAAEPAATGAAAAAAAAADATSSTAAAAPDAAATVASTGETTDKAADSTAAAAAGSTEPATAAVAAAGAAEPAVAAAEPAAAAAAAATEPAAAVASKSTSSDAGAAPLAGADVSATSASPRLKKHTSKKSNTKRDSSKGKSRRKEQRAAEAGQVFAHSQADEQDKKIKRRSSKRSTATVSKRSTSRRGLKAEAAAAAAGSKDGGDAAGAAGAAAPGTTTTAAAGAGAGAAGAEGTANKDDATKATTNGSTVAAGSTINADGGVAATTSTSSKDVTAPPLPDGQELPRVFNENQIIELLNQCVALVADREADTVPAQLNSIQIDDQNKFVVREKGLVQLNRLISYTSSMEVQEAAVAVLSQLSLSDATKFQEAMRGSILFLTTLINSPFPKTQQHAMITLATVVYKHPQNLEVCLKTKAVSLLLTLINRGEEIDTVVLIDAIICLRALAEFNPMGQQAIYEAQGVPAVLRLLSHPNQEVQMSAIDAVLSLVRSNAQIKELVQGSIVTIVHLLGVELESIRAVACGVLMELARDSEAAQTIIFQCRAVAPLINCIKSNNEYMQFHALGIITFLILKSDERRRAFVQAGLEAPVESLLESKNENIRTGATVISKILTARKKRDDKDQQKADKERSKQEKKNHRKSTKTGSATKST